MKRKTFKKERYIFFWATFAVYFIPYFVAIVALFPLMEAVTNGEKIGLGMLIFIINGIPFVKGIFRKILAHYPFFNTVAVSFCVFGLVFILTGLRDYMSSIVIIEIVACVSSIGACVLWHLHEKNVRYSEAMRAQALADKAQKKG